MLNRKINEYKLSSTSKPLHPLFERSLTKN
jgi:hypothetical protein